MGIFDNKSTTESKQWMEMPTWMEGMPQNIANMTMDQLQNGLPPEQQIAGLTPYQMEGIGGMFNYARGPILADKSSIIALAASRTTLAQDCNVSNGTR